MHELRSAIAAGEVRPSNSPVARKEACRRGNGQGGSLMHIAITRSERRVTDQRREDRFRGIVEAATIVFRRRKTNARVVNVSESGIMVETAIVPRIGESVGVEFDGFPRLDGIVRWVKEGRIGLDVGEGSIDLG